MNLEFFIFKGDKSEWNEGIGKFENATMYQSW